LLIHCHCFFYKNLKNYTIKSDGSTSCYGNPETGLVSAISEDLETSPSYHYNFKQGKLNCSFNSGELLKLSECLNRGDVRGNIGFVQMKMMTQLSIIWIFQENINTAMSPIGD